MSAGPVVRAGRRGRAGGGPGSPFPDRAPGLWWFVRQEVLRVFRAPYDVLLTCLFNLVLVCFGWYVLPQELKDWLFSLRAPQAFPVVLCFWLLADTPATNVIGSDPELAIRVLDSRALLKRFLWAKHIVFAVVVAVVCTAFAFALGIGGSRYGLIVYCSLLVAIAPFGTLAVASLQGILLPYRQLPVRWRWEHRLRIPQQVRWLTLLVLPYATVPFIASIVIYPSLTVLRLTSGPHQGLSHPNTVGLVLATIVAALLSALLVVVGHRLAWNAVRYRRSALASFLRNTQRG